MNLANQLTLFRIALIPFFILFLSVPQIPHGPLWALILFVIASYTDHLDGKIARERNLITNFGIFMDPFADKLLVTSAIIMLVSLSMIPAFVAIIIIAREFAVSGLRTLSAKEGTVIAASSLGKIKTTLQMLAIVLMLIKLLLTNDPWFANWISPKSLLLWIPDVVMYAAAFMTLYSGVDYFTKGWSAIDPKK
ncbi:CDP-diacylglycerol--glycerol-3-phosphate 3-phosphatidyltransferase [Clostridiaceae bacterium JG1575]|nr:CDP-diacylglycerol--glycerol-3-phosphate 3-phosphatidyltransferase [Clostridiaceae bacterium JG1575]